MRPALHAARLYACMQRRARRGKGRDMPEGTSTMTVVDIDVDEETKPRPAAMQEAKRAIDLDAEIERLSLALEDGTSGARDLFRALRPRLDSLTRHHRKLAMRCMMLQHEKDRKNREAQERLDRDAALLAAVIPSILTCAPHARIPDDAAALVSDVMDARAAREIVTSLEHACTLREKALARLEHAARETIRAFDADPTSILGDVPARAALADAVEAWRERRDA
jgi:hypothetical protein